MKRGLVLGSFGAIAAAASVYGGVLGASFVFDDPAAVVENPLVTGEAPVGEAFLRDFWGERPGYEHLASWRPLTVLALRAEHAAGGGDPAWFHVASLLLHLLVAAAATLAARRLGAAPAAAVLVGAAILLHPVFAEAVASIVGQGDLLVAASGAAALLAFAGPRPAWAALPVALGLLAKESGVVVLGTVFVLAVRERRAGLASGLALLGVVWYAARSAVVGDLGGEVPALDNPLVAADLGGRLAGGLGVAGRYLAWIVWPQPIAADHSAAVVLEGRGGGYAWLGAVGLAGLAAAWVAAFRRGDRALLAGLTVALSALVLQSNLLFVLPTPLAGRLAYLPAMGLLLAAAAAAGPLLARRAAGIAAGALALGWLAAGVPASHAIVRAWRDDRSLFEMSVDLEPRSARARANLGRALLAAGDLDRAERELRRGRELAPDHPIVLANLAVLLQRRGRIVDTTSEEAWEVSLEAARAESPPGRAHANLCRLALERRDADPEWRREVCEAAAAGLPGLAEPKVHLGRLAALAGDAAAAESRFREALAVDPSSEYAAGHLVTLLVRAGRTEEAIAVQRDLVARDPADATRRKNLEGLLRHLASERRRSGEPPP